MIGFGRREFHADVEIFRYSRGQIAAIGGLRWMFLFPLWVTRCSLSASVKAKAVEVGGAESGKRQGQSGDALEGQSGRSARHKPNQDFRSAESR